MAIRDVIDQIRGWPRRKKLALGIVILLTAGLMTGILLWSQRVDYQVLYSNLSQDDAGQVVTKLKELKIPYRVERNVIYVPAARVYELRLELASQGIPQGGGVGFELFDKTQIGVTEFVQRLNYVRALQGELSRTIRQLSEVDQCRVHIAIPEKTIFTEKEEKPTASVVLKLKSGRVLSQGQVGGIVHLVASSVEGLPARNVSVIDNMGNLLSRPSDHEMIADARHLEYQKAVDKEYETRLQSMLEGIVGKGKAIVRVSTKIDFTQVERTEERFDPDTIAVKSEQRTQEKSVGSATGGVPGALSNQPGQTPAPAAGQSGSGQKNSENISYEISRSVSKIIQPRGDVKALSVAVLVDGTYRQEKEKRVYVARTQEDVKKYEEIVKAAIGFNKDRGDSVIIENVAFESALDEFPPEKTDYVALLLTVLKYAVPLIAAALLILFVIKPLLRTLKVPPRAPAPEPVRVPAEKLEVKPAQEEIVKTQVLDFVTRDPRQTAMILKEWLSE